jgi:hypothetical protein
VRIAQTIAATAVAGLSLLEAPLAMAQSTIPTRMDVVLGEGDGPAPALVIVLVALAVVALVSAISAAVRMSRLPPPGPRLKQVYLGIRFRARAPGAPGVKPRFDQGHLLSVDMRSATLVSPRFAGKGERLTLRLDSLPGFPAAGETEVEAEVASYRLLDGRSDTYLLQLKLPASLGALRQPLLDYLETLAGRRQAAPT